MSDRKETCGSCKKWQHADAASDALPDSGECRAHPPVVMALREVESRVPVTVVGFWCWEHEPAPAKKTKAEHEAAATKAEHSEHAHHAKKH